MRPTRARVEREGRHHLIVTGDDPRILDIDLATALGMSRPRNIRPHLILPNREELETHGVLLETRANLGKPGRPSFEFHLNEQQALLVCMFSRTEKAADVRQEIIRVFRAYREGHLELSASGKIALPNFENPAEAARAFADLWEQGRDYHRAIPATGSGWRFFLRASVNTLTRGPLNEIRNQVQVYLPSEHLGW